MEFFQKLFNRLIGVIFTVMGFLFAFGTPFPANIFGAFFMLVGIFVVITGVNPRQLESGMLGKKQNKSNARYTMSREEQEEKIRQAGEKGEKDVAYALEWLDKNRFKVFRNLRLTDGGESQEFDSIVVGDKAVFNIETKNYIGDLTIDEEGNWYRIVNDRKSGMESPVFQVKRHNKVLNNILESKVPIVDLLVWANVSSVIEGVRNSSIKVIKVDQLMNYIDNFDGGRNLSEEERLFAIEEIGRKTVNS